MTAWVALGAVAAMAFAILALGGVVLARLRGYRRPGRKEIAASKGFTMARYEPLTRLLTDDDLDFLRRQSSCPEIAARWENARRRLIRMYLKDLAADFRLLHADARALVAESPEQYSDLVGVLMRQQFTFWRVMAETELRLTLSWAGLERMNARRLVEAIAAMQAEITQAITPPTPVLG